MKDKNDILFLPLHKQGIETIIQAFQSLGWNKNVSQYERYLIEQQNLERHIWVAWKGPEFVGYITLKLHSDYEPFRKRNIPEINDLNVLPVFRNNGIGSKLLSLAEEHAKTIGSYVGLGVGLFKDYGDAQRLYVKRGYVPDGLGITYQNKSILYNEEVIVNDDLILWFLKKL